MNSVLQRPFEKMGARVKVEPLQIPVRRPQVVNPVELDVREDAKGEYFSIRLSNEASAEVLDFRPKDRHLLLLSRAVAESRVQKARYLLGHDERHWFVAAIPEATPVSTVVAAKQALKPETVIAKETGLKNKHKHVRSNKAWIRQGEWFFVPAREAKVQEFLILKREPIARGGGKPHICDELYREGGETVYVSRDYPNGLTQQKYAELSPDVRSRLTWRTMRRNPRVLVRGRVRHRDHATVFLNGWHEVHVNTETRALAMRNVAFLD